MQGCLRFVRTCNCIFFLAAIILTFFIHGLVRFSHQKYLVILRKTAAAPVFTSLVCISSDEQIDVYDWNTSCPLTYVILANVH